MPIAPELRARIEAITEAMLERDLSFPRPAPLEACPAHARALEVVEAICEGGDGGDLSILPPNLRAFLAALYYLAGREGASQHLPSFLTFNQDALDGHPLFQIDPDPEEPTWHRTGQDRMNLLIARIAYLPPAHREMALRQMEQAIDEAERQAGLEGEGE